MNTVIVFQAISQAILTSLGQALVIYVLTQMFLSAFKDWSASWRYRLLYSSMVLILGGFVISFLSYFFSLSQVVNEGLNSQNSAHPAPSLPSWNLLTMNYSYWISIVYIGGLSFQAVRLMIGYFRLKTTRLRNIIPPPDYWTGRLKYLQDMLGITKDVTLHFSSQVLVPFTAGFIKPVILFPVALISQLSADQVESILLHELSHIKRNDYLMNLLQRIMEIILFFNPFTWLLAKQIQSEREFACDDLVLRFSHQPAVYARALTLIEEHRITADSLEMAVSGNKKNDLLTRIKKITNMKTQRTNPKQRLIALLSVLAIGISLAWIVPADTSKVKKAGDNVQQSLKSYSKADTIIPPPVPPAPPAPADLTLPNQPVPPPPPPADPKLIVPPAPPAPVDTNELKKLFNSKEWKEQMQQMKVEAEKLKKQFESPEWKKQMQDMQVEAEKMKKQFDSPEWKKQMQNMQVEAEKMKKQFDSPEWKKQIQAMQVEAEKWKKQFDSPEWKKQIQDMKVQSEKMKKQFDSPEWKKQMEDMKIETEKMKKQFDSPEWKKQMEELKTESEKIEKQVDDPESKTN